MPGIPVSAGFAIGLAFGVVGLLSGFCLMSSLRDWWTANDGCQFRRAYGQIAAGLAVGLLVTAGWLTTGWLGADEFNPIPVTSLSFVSPIADSLQYTMLSTGLTLSFGIALVAGVLSGSLVTAIVTGRFKLEGYTSPNHMVRSISGAALMGIGGAMAYGCSIGQGLTGLSTLGMPSFIAVAGIISGAALGIRGPVVIPALATR